MIEELSPSEAEAYQFLNPKTKELYAYWRSLQTQPGAAPPWSAFNPARISKNLPHILVIEIGGEDNFKIRLFGTALVEALGRDLTGTNYFDLIPSAIKEKQHRHIDKIITTPACGVSYTKTLIETEEGQVGLLSESIHLPMADETGAINRLCTQSVSVEEKVVEYSFAPDEVTFDNVVLKRAYFSA